MSILEQKSKDQAVRALVLPILLYGSETWSISARVRAHLNSFSTMELRRQLTYIEEVLVFGFRIKGSFEITEEEECCKITTQCDAITMNSNMKSSCLRNPLYFHMIISFIFCSFDIQKIEL